MDVYQSAIRLLEQQPEVQLWPELRRGLQRASHKAPIAVLLPSLACKAFGGREAAARPAVAAMTCAQISLLLVDDILDEDPRGEYHRLGKGRAANLSAAFASLANLVLLNTEALPQPILAARALNRMLLALAHGQDMDVQNQPSEAAYWQVTRAKSSTYFGASLLLGALCADADLEEARKLEQFGETYGEMMQIHDDLNDCLDSAPGPDWLEGRYSLPILFASIVKHPQRDRFSELRGNITVEGALEEAQTILVESGAISYCVNELALRHATAKQQLDDIKLADNTGLHLLLAEVIEPVQRLIATVGANSN
jgi:geranylgeranyl pyrophosphate synthase